MLDLFLESDSKQPHPVTSAYRRHPGFPLNDQEPLNPVMLNLASCLFRLNRQDFSTEIYTKIWVIVNLKYLVLNFIFFKWINYLPHFSVKICVFLGMTTNQQRKNHFKMVVPETKNYSVSVIVVKSSSGNNYSAGFTHLFWTTLNCIWVNQRTFCSWIHMTPLQVF